LSRKRRVFLAQHPGTNVLKFCYGRSPLLANSAKISSVE
jgi:hypothetical protein